MALPRLTKMPPTGSFFDQLEKHLFFAFFVNIAFRIAEALGFNALIVENLHAIVIAMNSSHVLESCT